MDEGRGVRSSHSLELSRTYPLSPSDGKGRGVRSSPSMELSCIYLSLPVMDEGRGVRSSHSLELSRMYPLSPSDGQGGEINSLPLHASHQQTCQVSWLPPRVRCRPKHFGRPTY